MNLSNLAMTLGGSAIREMFNEALKMKDTISFTVGEPDFVTPQPIIDAACDAWQKGLTHYTPNRGIQELREAIAQYHGNDLRPDPDQNIMISCGATEAIQLAMFTLVNPGEEVILVTPAWPNYFGQVGMCGAVAKVVPAYEENGFIPDPDDIRRAITDKTKLILLNSPSNPTGAVIDRGTYRRIAEILMEKRIYILADEIYSRLVYAEEPYTSICEFPELLDRVVYVSGFSKMFAMTGWRLGYAISTGPIIANMTKLHENGASCLPAPSQLAAAAGLTKCDSDIERMREIYRRRRDMIVKEINAADGMSCITPQGAFYAFANIKNTGKKSRDFCMDLLHNTGVVTVPGSGFGDAGEGYVRFTYATSEENIREGLKRVQDYLKKV
ncbi:MAG: pyridoxal phosphate-dependent aminotransferase [Bacillota bacterium]